ncbi:MAG: hypothetical protein ACI9W4_002884 [Rhodothermales bacterium]|jgi:hypothetical protein
MPTDWPTLSVSIRPSLIRPPWARGLENWAGALLLALLAVLTLPDAVAARQSQDPPGRFGFGLQAGPLSGFTIKGYPPRGTDGRFESLVLTGSLNFKGFAYTQAVLLDELPLRTSPLAVYLGPGLAGEVRDGKVTAGVASAVGIRFFKAHVEIFLELAPRLMLIPSREAYMAAGVGFRIYP